MSEEKTYTVEEVDQLLVNAESATWGSMRKAVASAISGGYDFGDTLHNIYLDYGYPEELEFFNFWSMYRRFGIANAIVELPIDTGWISAPTIKGSEKFDAELKVLIEKKKLWQRLKGLDTRQRVGRYAGMFMQVKDNKKPEEAIDGKLNGIGSLVKMIPLYESQLKVDSIEEDPTKDNFGLPAMYEYSSDEAGNRNENIEGKTFKIHPSRVVIASEGADNGGIYGISSLEASYNDLMDLRKIIGAGGEGFYKNAAKDVMFNIKDLAGARVNKELIADFNEQYDDWTRNRSRRSMLTPGLEAQPLESNLANPKEFFFNALYDVSAATKIPATILIGQQTGRLASSEDSKHFLSIIQSRREHFMTEMTMDNIDWLIEYGILVASEYTIEWDDLLAISDDEKLNNSDKMSTINEKQFKSGQGAPFSAEEVREAAGFELEELPKPDETKDTIIDDLAV